MANTTAPLLHGYINYTHTSNLSAFYPSQNLPTPWPLVLSSFAISLALICYGIKPAFFSWTDNSHSRPSPRKENGWLSRVTSHLPMRRFQRPRLFKRQPAVYESELENLHQLEDGVNDGRDGKRDEDDYVARTLHGDEISQVELAHVMDHPRGHGLDDDSDSRIELDRPPRYSERASLHEDVDPPPGFDENITPGGIAVPPLQRQSVEEETLLRKWDDTPGMKIGMIIIHLYLTFRAVAALFINISSLNDHHTPPSAPTVLLLTIISIQTYTSHRGLPRLLNFLSTLNSIIVTVAFLITCYSPLTSPSEVPAYAHLAISGGVCPVHAPECSSQVSHWQVVGCGSSATYKNIVNGDSNTIPKAKYYAPYGSSGDVNSESNALEIVEAVILVFGTIWLSTVLFHIYEARHLITSPFSRILRPLGPGPQVGRQGCGPALMGIIACIGVPWAFIAAIISIGGHLSQALAVHRVSYIDSVGPAVRTNFTYDSHGSVTGSIYWGNATSWNDCFTVTAPTSSDGFLHDWVGANGANLWRIAAGV